MSLFAQHVQDLHQSRDKGFEMEYQVGGASGCGLSHSHPLSLSNTQSLKVDPTASYDVAKLECNRSKNRFANIFPCMLQWLTCYTRITVTIETVETAGLILVFIKSKISCILVLPSW